MKYIKKSVSLFYKQTCCRSSFLTLFLSITFSAVTRKFILTDTVWVGFPIWQNKSVNNSIYTWTAVRKNDILLNRTKTKLNKTCNLTFWICNNVYIYCLCSYVTILWRNICILLLRLFFYKHNETNMLRSFRLKEKSRSGTNKAESFFFSFITFGIYFERPKPAVKFLKMLFYVFQVFF